MPLAVLRLSAILMVVAADEAAPAEPAAAEPVTVEPAAAEDARDAACQEQNVDYAGMPLRRVEGVVSPFLCQLQCQRFTACRCFTWNRVNKYCYLKTSVGGRRPNLHAVSGPRECAACNQEVSVDFYGNDIRYMGGVNSPALCQLLCQDEAACLYFSWKGRDEYCFLKHSDAGRRTAPDVVSGPRACH